jgi:hypothetical protein
MTPANLILAPVAMRGLQTSPFDATHQAIPLMNSILYYFMVWGRSTLRHTTSDEVHGATDRVVAMGQIQVVGMFQSCSLLSKLRQGIWSFTSGSLSFCRTFNIIWRFPKMGVPLVIIRCFLGSSNKKLRFGDPHCALNRRHLLAKGLREFDLRNADCRNDFDREFIYAGIIQWLLGSLRGQKSRSANIF